MNPGSHRSSESSLPNGLASTEWSLVLAASNEGGVALDRLCRAYWRPVYIFIRATGIPRSEAEDATQDFFADMLRRDWLKQVGPEHGSFRGFLRTSVRFFVNNRHRAAHAQKRGGESVFQPFDTEECERELEHLACPSADPAVLYEKSWALCLMQAALARLETEQREAGRTGQFEQLRPFLTSPPSPGDYQRIAGSLNIPAGHVAVWVHRLSRRFTELIRTEIAATVSDRRDVETELRYLVKLASGTEVSLSTPP